MATAPRSTSTLDSRHPVVFPSKTPDGRRDPSSRDARSERTELLVLPAMRVDADRSRALPRAPLERHPRLRRRAPEAASGPAGAPLFGGGGRRLPEARRRGDVAGPRRRARGDRDPAGSRHLGVLRPHPRDEDSGGLQPRLRDGGGARRRPRRKARARRRRALRRPGPRPRPRRLDREAEEDAGALGARALDALDRGRRRRARDPLPAPQRPLARDARHRSPPETDPGHDRVDDRPARRRDRRRQEPDEVAPRRQRRSGAEGLGRGRRGRSRRDRREARLAGGRQAARRVPRARRPDEHPQRGRAPPGLQGRPEVPGRRHRRAVPGGLRLPLPRHRRPLHLRGAARAGLRRRRREAHDRGARRRGQPRSAARHRPREDPDEDRDRRPLARAPARGGT